MLLCPQHSHSPTVTSFVLFLSATSLQPPVILKRAGQSASNLRCSSSPLGPSKHSHSQRSTTEGPEHKPDWGCKSDPSRSPAMLCVQLISLTFLFFSFSPYFSLHIGLRNRLNTLWEGVPGRRAPEPLPAGLFAHPECCGSRLTTSEPAASQLPAILIFMLLSSRRFSALRSRCTICRPWQ